MRPVGMMLAAGVIALAAAPSALAVPGDFNEAPGSPYFPDIGNATAVATGDFDEDGDIDFLGSSPNQTYTFENDGTGRFALANTEAGGANEIAIADVDGDGHLDFIAQDSGGLRVREGEGDGSFLGGFVAGGFFTLTGVVAEDLDGDGDIDMAASRHHSGSGGIPVSGSVSVFRNDGLDAFGRAEFTASTALGGPLGRSPADIATGSFEFAASGNNVPDLATANTLDDDVSILLRGPGDAFGSYSQPDTSPEAAGDAPSAIVSARLDTGVVDDLAVANAESDDVSVLLANNLGTGDFSPPFGQASVPVGDSPEDLVAADFDGDGRKDLAVANRGDGTVSILLGSGDGTFTEAPTSPEPVSAGLEGPVSLAVGDFDANGLPDLVVASRGAVGDLETDGYTVLLNDFAPPAPDPGSGPAPGAGSGTDPAASVDDRVAPRLRIVGKRLRLLRGRVPVRLRCPVEEASGPCVGSIRLQLAKGPAKRVVLGRAKFEIPSGETGRVRIRLAKAGAKLLRKRSVVRKVRATAVVADQRGNERVVAKRMRLVARRAS